MRGSPLRALVVVGILLPSLALAGPPVAVELKAGDGVEIRGDFYELENDEQKSGPMILLFHQAGRIVPNTRKSLPDSTHSDFTRWPSISDRGQRVGGPKTKRSRGSANPPTISRRFPTSRRRSRGNRSRGMAEKHSFSEVVTPPRSSFFWPRNTKRSTASFRSLPANTSVRRRTRFGRRQSR